MDQDSNPDSRSNSFPSSKDEISSISDLQITNQGFQFLLQDVHSQVWRLLLEYLEMAEEMVVTLEDSNGSPCRGPMDMVEMIGFLCTLGTLEVEKVSKIIWKILLKGMIGRDFPLSSVHSKKTPLFPLNFHGRVTLWKLLLLLKVEL